MFSQQLAKFKIETKIKTSLRARGPPGVSGALCSLRILRIGRIGSDEVNECSQFTVSSGIARSDSDSDNECESIESSFEIGDNDPQMGTSELSGCEVK